MGLAKDERAAAVAGEGCLGKAHPDEPVFILRAQDVLAAALVDRWADLAQRAGTSYGKVHEARVLAQKMREWPTRKLPD